MKRTLAAVGLAVALGCGSSSKGGSSTQGSASVQCTYGSGPSSGVCLTLTAPSISADQKTGLQNECTTDGGTYAEGPCSTANAVPGTCTATDPSAMTSVAVSGMSIKGTYATAHFDATSAAAHCSSWGTWQASGGGGGGTTVSCTWAGEACQQLTGTISSSEQTQLQSSCTGAAGTYAASACSTAGTVPGSCYYANGNDISPITLAGATTARTYYDAAAFSSTTAQADCAAPPAGAWQP